MIEETEFTILVSMVPTEGGTKQGIVDVAYDRFAAHGFKKVTMDEIAAELAISKKTLYKYFESKEAILGEIVEQRLARGETALASLLEHSGTVDERIRAVGELIPRFVDPAWHRLIADIAHTSPSLLKHIQPLMHRFIVDAVPKVLREGQRKGMVRKDLNIDLFVVAYLGAAKELLQSDFLLKHPVTEEAIPKQLLKIFLEGVLVRK